MNKNMDLYSLLSILVGLCFLVILISIVGYSLYHGITPMPTSFKVKNSLLQVLPDCIGSKIIYELGSGWGTLALPLASRYPKNQVIAYENSLIPFLISKIRLRLKSYSNLTIRKSDFFFQPIAEAGLVVCYLYPGAMQKLKIKFEQELKPGTWVISNTFAIPGWKPKHVCQVKDLYCTKIYIYQY